MKKSYSKENIVYLSDNEESEKLNQIVFLGSKNNSDSSDSVTIDNEENDFKKNLLNIDSLNHFINCIEKDLSSINENFILLKKTLNNNIKMKNKNFKSRIFNKKKDRKKKDKFIEKLINLINKEKANKLNNYFLPKNTLNKTVNKSIKYCSSLMETNINYNNSLVPKSNSLIDLSDDDDSEQFLLEKQ